jgi:hypothetical protein
MLDSWKHGRDLFRLCHHEAETRCTLVAREDKRISLPIIYTFLLPGNKAEAYRGYALQQGTRANMMGFSGAPCSHHAARMPNLLYSRRDDLLNDSPTMISSRHPMDVYLNWQMFRSRLFQNESAQVSAAGNLLSRNYIGGCFWMARAFSWFGEYGSAETLLKYPGSDGYFSRVLFGRPARL